MTWFKVDDGWARHEKTRAAGRDGRALWITAGPECAAARTDGVVSAQRIKDCAYLAGVPSGKATRLLVACSMWHDAETLPKCLRCRDAVRHLGAGELITAGGVYFHDWTDYQPTKDEALIPQERLRWRRKNALSKDRHLCEQIVSRDRGMCRYCLARVDFRDKRGPAGGTYDHVDPDGSNALDNVVVACRKCNGEKKDRTPSEWLADGGRPLLPVPAPYQLGLDSEPDRSQLGSGSDLAPTPARSRGGAGQVGADSELTRSQVGAGQAGDGPVLAGTGPGPGPGGGS